MTQPPYQPPGEGPPQDQPSPPPGQAEQRYPRYRAPEGQQPNPQQPNPQQPNPPYPGQPYQGQQYPGQPHPGQPWQGPQYPGPQYPGPQYPGPQYPGQPRKTSGFAIAGFILGLVGAILLAPIFCLIALRKIKRSGDGGRGLAIAGLVLTAGWAGLLALGIVAVIVDDGKTEVGDTTAISNLQVGQCFDADLNKTLLMTVKIADCAAPHTGEAYGKATAELTAMSDDDRDVAATEACAQPFEDFVGKPFNRSALDLLFVVLQDREDPDGNVLCMVGTKGDKLTASMRGSNR
jgi:hypothetical protein